MPLRPFIDRLPTGVRNALLHAGLKTAEAVASRTRADLLRIRNLGATGVDHIEATLGDEGLTLKREPPPRSQPGWERERSEAVRILRDLCKQHGDNDWPDDLHLADVIDKHLGRHLDGRSNG